MANGFSHFSQAYVQSLAIVSHLPYSINLVMFATGVLSIPGAMYSLGKSTSCRNNEFGN